MKNQSINRKQLINKFIEFYKSKDHKQILNASLIPDNDPTVLFTTAGMHPLVPYLSGNPHPLGKRLCNVQRCIRTQDIDEVGDNVHHTFFEMLGKWSLGDYWKKQAIGYTFEFLTKTLNIPLNKLAVSCFKGDKDAPKDEEAANAWLSLGIPKERIAFLPKSENWWGPAGKTGPCGPDTEVFYWSSDKKPPKTFNPDDKTWVEIGNDVLMQCEKDEKGNYNPAKQKNIDFGGGVERTITILSGLDDNYQSTCFLPIIKQIEKLSNKPYSQPTYQKSMRIIADHIKASVMIMADGISPSNLEQGYVLRRLIRKSIRHGRNLNLKNFTVKVAEPVFKIYDDYPHVKTNKQKILEELQKEELKFLETLENGITIFNKLSKDKKQLSGKDTFLLFQSYGFPLEITQELASEKNIRVNAEEFNKEFIKHQKLSRTATEGKFKSGLQDSSEQTTRLHTATHLLHAALRKVLGNTIQQKGSNITPERLRFDFSFDRKLTKEELSEVEDLVNQSINKGIPVAKQEVSPQQAQKSGALGFFEHKYGDIVSVYTINNISKEVCAGPHVKNTSELGTFKIKKEESSAAGVRRIKAELLDLDKNNK